MTRIDTSSSLREMVGPPVALPVSVRLRATVASWARRPHPQAIAVYLAVRLCGVAVLAVMAAHNGQKLLDRLTAWDGQWYLKIAELGYQGVAGTDRAVDAAGHPYADAPWAFFPLYAWFSSLLAELPGINLLGAALLVSLGSGIAAACALQRIGRLFYPHRPVGLILVALWAGAPMAIVLSMPYTEALFVALAAWALVGVLEKQWWLAGICCIFAGLARSTASALIVVVVAAAVVAVWRGRNRWPAIACAVMAPLGLAGYWTAVAARTGSITGWQDIERIGWHTRFDGGQQAVQFVIGALTHDGSVMQTATALIMLGAIALSVLTVTTRLPWPLAAYAIGVAALAIATAGFPAMKARFLLPAFPLLIPIAVGLASRKPKTIVATVAAAVLVGAWFSGHGLTSWHYAI
jgi:hypothetical protein